MSHAGTMISEVDSKEHKSKWIWGAVIIGLLCVQIVMSLVAIMLATGDPAQTIVPQYHDQALKWDERVAMKDRSKALGWKWQAELLTAKDVLGNRAIEISLLDKEGNPIVGADIQLKMWHHARGSEVIKLKMNPVADKPGRYQSEAMIRKSGLWHIDLTSKQAGHFFWDEADQNWSAN